MHDEDETCLQESPRKKRAWLVDAKKEFPLGRRVQVINSDLHEYVGATGRVVGYDIEGHGEWPTVEVQFDRPIDGKKRDLFFIDAPGEEIVPLRRGTTARRINARYHDSDLAQYDRFKTPKYVKPWG